MNWWQQVLTLILGGGGLVALIELLKSRLNRRDTVADRAEDKADRISALDRKVESYKKETDSAIIAVSAEVKALDKRFAAEYENLDKKLDDANLHSLRSNRASKLTLTDKIMHLCSVYTKNGSVTADQLRMLTEMFDSVCELAGVKDGVDDDPEILWLQSLMDKVLELPIK